MTFITLAESKEAKKGNIVVTVIKIGELKAGSSSARDWTRKDITLQDSSGAESMSVWNDDIKLFHLNHKYELTGIYWKENKGKLYLNFGQYSNLRDCGTPVVGENQSTIDNSTQTASSQTETTTTATAPTSDEFLKQKQEQIKKEQEELNKKLNGIFTEDQIKTITKQVDIIHAIELLVTKQLKTNTIDPNVQKVGMYVKIIYDKIGNLLKE